MSPNDFFKPSTMMASVMAPTLAQILEACQVSMTSTFRVLESFTGSKYVVPMATPDADADLASVAWRLVTELMLARKEEFPQLAASVGLNPGAMHALLHLDPDEPQSMSTLAGAWKCDASNVTWLVDRLEENGLAERRPHPSDRRVRTVALTRKGAKVRAQIEARMYEAPDAFARFRLATSKRCARSSARSFPTRPPHRACRPDAS